MKSLPGPDLLIEAVMALLYSLLGIVLAIGGAIAEYSSYQYIVAGDVTLALWFALLGALLLYAAVVGIGYQKLLSQYVLE